MSLQLPSSADLSELLHDVRLQLHALGDHGLSVLAEAFAVNGAAPPNGRVTSATLAGVLSKVGVFMRTQQLSAWFRYLDRDNSGSVLSADVLAAVQGTLSARRHRLLVLVFRSLDSDNGGAIPLQRLFDAFDGSQHPQVLDGSRSSAQVADNFRLAFQGSPSPLPLAAFLDRFSAISAVVPLDDDFFCATLERCFRVVEPKGDSRLSLLNRVRHLLRERTSQRESGPKTESEKLRLMLKWWDLQDSGLVTFPQFHGALQRFGLVLDDSSTRGLFDLFDPRGVGAIRYAEFVAILYEDDIVNTYWTQRQQRERQQQQEQQQHDTRPEQEEKRAYYETEHALIAAQQPAVRTQPSATATVVNPTAAPAAAPATSTTSALRPLAVFVLGGPGSGKGTQCARIVKEFGFEHLSTGDLLRAEQSRPDSDLAPLIAACIAQGQLVPVELIVRLLDRAIERALAAGRRFFLVDGFPRAVDQKASWDFIVGDKRHIAVPFILYFDCPLPVLEQRLLARGATSGRADDNLEAIKKRFLTFEQESRPVVQLFAQEGRVRLLDGTQTPDQVYDQVRGLIQSIV